MSLSLQALIGTAIGLGPEAFRLMLQSNGATTAISFLPAAEPGQPAQAVMEHTNQVISCPRDDASCTPHARLHGSQCVDILCQGGARDPACELTWLDLKTQLPRWGTWLSWTTLRPRRRAMPGCTLYPYEKTGQLTRSTMRRGPRKPCCRSAICSSSCVPRNCFSRLLDPDLMLYLLLTRRLAPDCSGLQVELADGCRLQGWCRRDEPNK